MPIRMSLSVHKGAGTPDGLDDVTGIGGPLWTDRLIRAVVRRMLVVTSDRG